MGDEQHAQVGAELGVDALGDDAQRVDVEAGVGLVEDRELGLEHGHLEHLEALLLAAREALVDVARGEAVVELEQRHLLAHQLAEVAHADAAAGRIRRVDIGLSLTSRPRRRALSAVRRKLATDRPGMAVGYWNARKRPSRARLSGDRFEDVPALPDDLAARDLVCRVAHQRIGERRLARAVAAHDRVDLALADGQVDALEDLARRVRDRHHVQVADDQLAVTGLLVG